MDLDRIKQQTGNTNISHFDSIDSTNSYLLAHGECGDVCISDRQTAGRGRRGNNWVSPDTGNLYFSLCWCFGKITENWSLLGLVVAIAIAETLQEVGLENHAIKWPNDIFWQQKKLGGVLIETLNQSARVVIGIGLNLKMSKEDRQLIDQEIVSLDEAMPGKIIVRDDLIVCLINKLKQHLNSFNSLNPEAFMEKWKCWDMLYGEHVSLTHQGQELAGKVSGIDSQGRLGIIESMSAKQIYFSSAEIRLKNIGQAV